MSLRSIISSYQKQLQLAIEQDRKGLQIAKVGVQLTQAKHRLQSIRKRCKLQASSPCTQAL